MRLLLTAFEPFGGETVNPSWEVARALEAESPAGVELSVLRLPVRGGVAAEQVLPILGGREHDAWLGLGQAEGRAGLWVERRGVNALVDRGPDGRALAEVPLIEGGPEAHEVRLPIEGLAAAMQVTGVPVGISDTAGRYVCNELLYMVLDALERAARELPAVFIHLPYLPEQAEGKPDGTPSLSLRLQVEAVHAAVGFLGALVGAGAGTAPEAGRA